MNSYPQVSQHLSGSGNWVGRLNCFYCGVVLERRTGFSFAVYSFCVRNEGRSVNLSAPSLSRSNQYINSPGIPFAHTLRGKHATRPKSSDEPLAY